MTTGRVHAACLLAALCAGGLQSVAHAQAGTPATPDTPIVVGYVFSPGGPLDPATVDASRITHVNYAFSRIVDGELVEGFAHDTDNYRQLAALRTAHPTLRLLTSVGGWTWSDTFSDMARTPETRARFITSAVAFSRRHQLDGIDIDWEYPGLPGAGNPHADDDGANFTLLLRALRVALDTLAAETGRAQLLTIASGGFPDFIARSDIGNWQESLDFINIMAYDYNIPTDGRPTGHHAPLHAHPDDAAALSGARAVRDHMAAGVPAHKLVLGVPFYGRSWTRVDAGDAAAAGLHRNGHAGEAPFGGDASYRNLVAGVIGSDGWERHWDPVAQAPWLWHPGSRTFVSYEDAESIRAKAAFVRANGLRGMMYWQNAADHDGTLLDAIVEGLRQPDDVVVAPSIH